MKGNKTSSDNNKVVYQISLSSGDLDLINPYLYIEKLQEEITSRVPSVKVIIICNTKAQSRKPVQLKCFATNSLLDYREFSVKVLEIKSISNKEKELRMIRKKLKDLLVTKKSFLS